ncbi:MAG: NAD(P)/FAD-dependent oxidoreductase [Acidobacteriota bacterium]|nr:NAD(P)/FAD-dependent oxidoreductase [Acidobacteriota bacterium]
MSRVCIVGGGFTGLAAGLELASAGLPVTIFEKDQALGGLAGSFLVGDQMLEKFYHHWFTNDRFIMQLVKRLNLEDRIVLRESRTGMYYAHNFFKLSAPLDVLRFTPLSVVNRLRLGLGALKARRVQNWEELEAVTAKDWLIGLFGRKVYEVVWEPLLIGKFGRVSSEISAVWFWNKLKLRGSSRSKGGAEQLAYYRGGFAALAAGMAKEIERLGGEIRTHAEVTGLEVRGGRAVRIHSTSGTVESEAVILTTPLPLAADLLAPHTTTAYVSELRRIRYLSNVCLVLELDRSLSSLYWLNVNDPSFPFVGIIEHTNFEPVSSYGGRHIVYLSKYLPPEAELYRMGDTDLLAFSVAAIARMFPKFSRDWVKAFHVWRADYSQPIIEQNYSSLIPKMETPIENVFLSTMAQVYPEDRGTNYAVRGGMEVASLIKKRIWVNSSQDVSRERHIQEA